MCKISSYQNNSFSIRHAELVSASVGHRNLKFDSVPAKTLKQVQGDKLVIQGDGLVVQGDRLVVRGDELVVQGDKLGVNNDVSKIDNDKLRVKLIDF